MILTASDLTAIRERALRCDDAIRARRGQPPRPTRCRSCRTILLLLAHLALVPNVKLPRPGHPND
jgi:hypothetical protein